MKKWLLDIDRLKRASRYVAAGLLSLLLACFVLKLWKADLRVPLHYNGDALLHAMFIRGILDNFWYWQNPLIGMPTGLEMYDFPAVDNSAAVILWLFSLFTRDAILVLNLFYLLTFPLITVSAVYVFRRFNFSYVTSLFCGLLYTFLPYHFMRDESHLFLSAYYFVPLIVMVLLWTSADRFSNKVGPHHNPRFNPGSREFILSVLICVLMGASGIYYPFFSCFLLLIAGILGSFNRATLRPLAAATILIAVTCASLVANLSPSLINIYRHGNTGVTQRSLAGPEIYGLKVSQLLLPVTGHRIRYLNQLKELYNNNTQVTENDAAALGLIGSVGFLTLLAVLFYRRRNGESTPQVLLADVAVLNIFAVLLGTIGGLGSLFALFVSAGIRSYNRISVFIAFFSIMAVAVGVDHVYEKAKTIRTRIVLCVMVALVLLAGIFDQTTKGFVPDYPGIKAEFLNDDNFVQGIEASVPAGAMIFQVPYVPFPEHPHVNRMVDYDHLRGYLHSRTLRWSYGAMKNREGDRWQHGVAALPTDEFVQTLAFAGFSGIYLDRHGYEDNGASKETELANTLQAQPNVSANKRLVFFNMSDYSQRLRAKYSNAEWTAKQEATLHPVMLEWTGGFSGPEAADGRTWRWCSSEGELRIRNTSQKPRKISLEMFLASGYEQYDDLIISGPSISKQLKTNSTPAPYASTIVIPPGESVIKFASSAKRVDAPLDPRVLVFRVENFKMRELE